MMILELLRERVQEHAPEPEKEPVHKPDVCPACHTEHPYDDILLHAKVCPTCSKYLRMTARERIAQIFDPDSFQEIAKDLTSVDFLQFPGYAEKLDLPCEYDPDIMKKTWYNVPKVLMMTTDEKAQRLIPEFQKKYAGKLKVSGSSKGFIEFNNPAAHKGAGLEWVAGYLSIAQKDTVAVGDNSLDLEMIRWAGLGCAVDNGKPEVKEAADLVIPSCADFGVARLIECIINGKV